VTATDRAFAYRVESNVAAIVSSAAVVPPDVRERLPNLLIAGVPKGGTTSLFRYLAQHPGICASQTKELRFFDPVRYGEPVFPLESYAEHFQHWTGERYRMEGTPGYFSGGTPVATAVSASLDEPRVLISLRDPVERCWSWYRFVRGRARIPKEMTFADYIDCCEELHERGVDGLRENQAYVGLRGGCYDDWYDSWRELLGDRLHVEFFDDLVEDPARVTRSVLRWLGLDERPADGFRFAVENRSVQYRSRPVLQAALVLNRRAERFFEQHADLKRKLRKAYYMVNRPPDDDVLEPAQRERIAAFYAPHNAHLAASLRASHITRLPAWLPA
jgi:Sulfotransferase domain